MKKLNRAYKWLRSTGRAHRVPGDLALLVLSGLVLVILVLWRW